MGEVILEKYHQATGFTELGSYDTARIPAQDVPIP